MQRLIYEGICKSFFWWFSVVAADANAFFSRGPEDRKNDSICCLIYFL